MTTADNAAPTPKGLKLARCPRWLMCSRPFRPLGFAHLCRSRPRGSVHSSLPSQLLRWSLALPTSSRQLPSCFAVYPRDFPNARVLCRSSHSLHPRAGSPTRNSNS